MKGSAEEFSEYLRKYSALLTSEILISCVNDSSGIATVLESFPGLTYQFLVTPSEQSGLKNSYNIPERMGIDRWLAMLAAKHRASAAGFIVADFGTAATFDVVSSSGRHLGGYILPGLEMASSALFSTTDKVMDYREDNKGSVHLRLGNNTTQCVHLGIVNQMLALLNQLCGQYQNYKIFLTGGDSGMIAREMPESMHFTMVEDLVLEGIELCEVKP